MCRCIQYLYFCDSFVPYSTRYSRCTHTVAFAKILFNSEWYSIFYEYVFIYIYVYGEKACIIFISPSMGHTLPFEINFYNSPFTLNWINDIFDKCKENGIFLIKRIQFQFFFFVDITTLHIYRRQYNNVI